MDPLAEYESLTLQRDEDVAILRLTRPESHNTFDQLLHTEFTEALAEIRRGHDLRAVVLLSSGESFSAGGDFALMEECHEHVAHRTRIVDDGRALMGAFLDLPQPVVVGVNGDVIGLGASIVLCCDAIVAPRTARIGDPHVRIGLVAGDGGCFAWPLAVGMPRARRYLLSGELVDAEQAWQWGMVTDLVETPDEAETRALQLARELAQLPPLAVQGTKRSLNRVAQLRAGEVLDLSFAQEMVTLASDDLLEAIAAFRERRPPVYKGE